MAKQKVVAVFDVGKTNKKLFLFDEQYRIVHEESAVFEEIKDEDGFPAEDLPSLAKWILDRFRETVSHPDYQVKAVNISAYGASLVHLDEQDFPLTPLYNYLKPYPERLKKQFYEKYGGESLIAKQTASPVLGSLNSGMQLYRLKYEQPGIFSRLKYSLHLPQYLSFLLSSVRSAEITSIGCHTQLWDFNARDYHRWVREEELQNKFPAILPGYTGIPVTIKSGTILKGIGLHDSSAALIPYLKLFREPFLLLSTGTWCISFNPFNDSKLSDDELNHDGLCYLTYEGKPVKASRLFAGKEHEEQVKRMADHFDKEPGYHKTIQYNRSLLKKQNPSGITKRSGDKSAMLGRSAFGDRLLSAFDSYEEAYHRLMADIMEQQVYSTRMVLSQSSVKNIYVDGGFAGNDVFMHMLALSFPQVEVYAAKIAQASALGAALVLHEQLNKEPIPDDLIGLTHYASR